MEYTSPGAALSQGLTQGLTLASNFQQMKAQREQAKWERELKVAEMGMKLSENKNIPLDQRLNAFNKGVRPVLTRLGIDMPEMTAALAQTNTWQDAVSNSTKVIDQMQSGKIAPDVGFNAITGHFNTALKDMNDLSEAQKTQRELTMGAAKRIVDESEKAKGKGADNTPSPAEAIKRQNELQIQLANLTKQGGMSDQITAAAMKKAYGVDIDPGKVTPEMREQVRSGVKKELSLLNQYLPDEYRHKEGITLAEAKALKEKGFTTDRMSRDFFVTDAPGGMDPLAMSAKRPVPAPGNAPGPSRMPPAAPAAMPGNARPVTPPPLATPAPMAAPAQVQIPTAGPLSLAGGAVQPTQAGPLRLDNRTLQ